MEERQTPHCAVFGCEARSRVRRVLGRSTTMIDEEVFECPRRYSKREDTLREAGHPSPVHESTASVAKSWGLRQASYAFQLLDRYTTPAPRAVAEVGRP